MTIGRIQLATATVAAAGLLLSACGGDSTKDSDAKGTDATLTVALGDDPGTVYPRAISPLVREVSRPVVDSLLDIDPATRKAVPWLAESFTANSDATEFTLRLRSGITFSDGTPLTAKVVKDNFDDIIKNKAALAGSAPTTLLAQGGYKETVVVDDNTIVQKFATPYPTWPLWLSSSGFGIVAPATLALPLDARFDKVIGTGPFVLESYQRNNSVTLTRRAGYKWAPQTRKHEGDAYLGKVVFRVIKEPSVRTGALKSGQIQVATGLSAADTEPLRSAGFTIVSKTIPRNTEALVVTGADRAPLNDVKVRQALVKAVDGTQIRDTLLVKDWAVPTSVVTAQTVGYADQSSLLKTDPAGAAALLDQAGWAAGSDGVRTKGGARLTVKLGWLERGNQWDRPLIELLTDGFKKIGIEVKPELATPAQAVEALKSRKWDLFLSGIAGGLDAGTGLQATFGSAPPNFYNIQDTALQPLLKQQATLTDPAARDKLVADIQQHIISQGLAVPLVEDTAVLAVAEKVDGFELGVDARLSNLLDVRLS